MNCCNCSDALLADLQTTQRSINGEVVTTIGDNNNYSYDDDDDDEEPATMYYQHEPRQTYISDSRRQSSPTPPPLPPLPSRDILDTVQASTVSCVLLRSLKTCQHGGHLCTVKSWRM